MLEDHFREESPQQGVCSTRRNQRRQRFPGQRNRGKGMFPPTMNLVGNLKARSVRRCREKIDNTEFNSKAVFLGFFLLLLVLLKLPLCCGKRGD